jgi:hypothetical protein
MEAGAVDPFGHPAESRLGTQADERRAKHAEKRDGAIV